MSKTGKLSTLDQLRATTNRIIGFIGDLVSEIADAIPTKTSEIENDSGYISGSAKSITLAADGWAAAESGTYAFSYTLTDADITADHRADVILDADSVAVASAAELYPGTETSTGAVTFRSVYAPTAPITGRMYLSK